MTCRQRKTRPCHVDRIIGISHGGNVVLRARVCLCAAHWMLRVCHRQKVVRRTKKSLQIHAADTLMFLHLTNLFVCRSSFVQAFGIAIVCCHHVKPAFNILRGSEGRCKQREPFRGLGMCSRERSRSAERLADRFAAQKGRFLPWDHDNKDAAVVSIRSVHASGHPRRTAYGCTSHALLRNVFPTCMTRPHESKLSCGLWIEERRASDL